MKKILSIIVGVIMLSMPIWLSEYIGNMYPQVSLVYAKTAEYQPYVFCSGTVSKKDTDGIFFEFPMYAKDIDVKIGEKVEVGQRLFTVDVEKTAEHIITLAKSYEKYLPSYLDKSVVEKIVNISIQDFIDMNYLPKSVYSTKEGTIAQINVSKTSLNDPSLSVVSYKEGSEVFLTLQIGEEDYSKIKYDAKIEGTTATVEAINAAVTSVQPTIKTSFSPTGSKKIIEFTAKIENTENILPDTSVTAKIYYSEKVYGTIAPYTAVGQDKTGEYIYTYDGTINKKYIDKTCETPDGYLMVECNEVWIVSDVEKFESINKKSRILPIYSEVNDDD